MKTNINKKSQLSLTLNSTFSSRGYYFHPDEDFREDWDWGKTQQVQKRAAQNSDAKKPIEKSKI